MQILFMLLKQQNQKNPNYACFVAAVRHIVMWILKKITKY